jgi:hypothetical protein
VKSEPARIWAFGAGKSTGTHLLRLGSEAHPGVSSRWDSPTPGAHCRASAWSSTEYISTRHYHQANEHASSEDEAWCARTSGARCGDWGTCRHEMGEKLRMEADKGMPLARIPSRSRAVKCSGQIRQCLHTPWLWRRATSGRLPPPWVSRCMWCLHGSNST